MVYIVTKKIKGNEYLYLVESIREKAKTKQKTIKYIGKKRPITKEEFECMKFSYNNEDWVLDNQKDQLSYQKHNQLQQISNQRKKYLKELDKTSKEKEREKFLSEFIANSNSIEGSTLTPNATFHYLFEDIVPAGHKKKELYMADNMLRAWVYLETNKNRLPNIDDLKILHHLVNENIEERKTLGKYKVVQNYIDDIYTTSYLFVEEKTKQLFKWIKKSFNKINNFEVVFQSHIQFEIIHPFVDGNGRVGRLLMNWLLMYKKIEPFAIRTKRRNEYISALNNSRRGKIETICQFCFEEYIEQYKFYEL